MAIDYGELKRCPFCKGKAKEERSMSVDRDRYTVYCCDCEAKTRWFNTREEARQSWDRRAP